MYDVWNTTAVGNSISALPGSTVGIYWSTEIPLYAGNNNNINDKYTSFGACTSASSTLSCGVNTGFYRTPTRRPSLIIGLQICTSGSLPAHDSITVTFEGSNQPTSSLNLGSS